MGARIPSLRINPKFWVNRTVKTECTVEPNIDELIKSLRELHVDVDEKSVITRKILAGMIKHDKGQV